MPQVESEQTSSAAAVVRYQSFREVGWQHGRAWLACRGTHLDVDDAGDLREHAVRKVAQAAAQRRCWQRLHLTHHAAVQDDAACNTSLM